MFGSKKIKKVAEGYEAMAQETQKDIDLLNAENPFESASSKSAMVKAAQNAQQFYNRSMNTMGAGATPEAMIAAQGATQQAMGSAAGQIATGAEASKTAQLNSLQSLQQRQSENAGSTKVDAVKTGWNNFFNMIPAVGQIAQGVGQGAEGAAQVAMLAASDRRLKENIKYIGELQGQKVYKFNYIGNPSIIIGVMAQDIMDEHPDWIGEVDGYMHVAYDRIFKEVEE